MSTEKPPSSTLPRRGPLPELPTVQAHPRRHAGIHVAASDCRPRRTMDRVPARRSRRRVCTFRYPLPVYHGSKSARRPQEPRGNGSRTALDRSHPLLEATQLRATPGHRAYEHSPARHHRSRLSNNLVDRPSLKEIETALVNERALLAHNGAAP